VFCKSTICNKFGLNPETVFSNKIIFKIKNNLKTGAEFTTLHFLRNFRICLISWSVISHLLERLAGDEHSSLLEQFVSYKENEMNWAPEALFITLHFLRNFQICLISWSVMSHLLERLAGDKHSSLLETFVSYEKNEMLWMQLQGPHSQHFIFFVTFIWAQ
jgi:hypothetical protein